MNLRSTGLEALARAAKVLRIGQQFVFVLGTMRSGSSLLTHFLLSSRDTNGWGEQNAVYKNELDLFKLIVRTGYRSRRRPARAKYYVDQINHNHFTPDPALFNSERLRTIVLVRSPQATISSIVNLSKQFYGGKWGPEAACEYYIKRLAFLKNHLADSNALCIQYEHLCEEPERELKRLEIYLDIKIPHYTSYPLQPFTGTRGDPGKKITQGQITAARSHQENQIPAPILATAGQAYRDFLKA